MAMERKKPRNLSPRHKANFLSRIAFWYLKSLLDRVRSDKFRGSQLSFDFPSSERSELLGSKLETKWKKEVEDAAKAETGGPRLWRAIFRAFKCYFVEHVLQVVFFELVVSIVQPLLIVSSLDYKFPDESPPISHISSRIAGYAVLLSLHALLASHTRLQQRENGARLRSACASLIYRKITRLSCSTTGETTSKAIIQILEDELKNFDKFFAHIHNVWVTPLQVVVVACILCSKVGASCLLGVSMLILQGIPIKVYVNKIATGYRSKVASWTEERVSIVKEVLRKIREIKIYCWEGAIEKSVFNNRHYEIDILKIASFARGLQLASYVVSEYTSIFSVILVYTLLGYTGFEHDKIFLVVLYVYVLHESVIFTFPKALATVVRANNSVKKIEQFLILEEVEPNVALSMLSNDNSSISMKDVNASWTKNSEVNLLENIDVCVPPKKLYAVSGPAGAGKTSFLKLILGEMRPSSGEISVNGSISYASQKPWFFLGTLRDNILCSEVYDELQYRQLIEMCGLDPVFEMLPKGDETLMLNGDTTLTDEQEMKINLARALYREADIYILDEIFTLLDDKVFEACMNGVLKDKTRIIVFQQDSPLLMLADEIIIFEQGQIKFQGTYESYENSSKFIEPQNKKIEVLLEDKTEVKRVTTLPLNIYHHQEERQDKEPDETEEFLTKSSSSDWLYWRYLKAGNSYVSLGFLLLFCVLAETFICSSDYWIGYWTDYWNTPRRSDPDVEYLLYVYLAFILGTIVFFVARNILFLKSCLDSSEKTHNMMISRLLRTPMRFFYGNPTETILQRFSKDVGLIDNDLPEAMLEMSHISFSLLGASFFLAVINYWSIIPICAMGFLYYRLICLYSSTIPKLRLLEHKASKKTLCHVESTISGLPTIRNSRAQRLVLRGFSASQDARSSARNLVLSSIAGMRFWLDLMLAILGMFVVVGFLALRDKLSLNLFGTLASMALTLKQFMVIARMARLGLKATTKVVEQKARLDRLVSYTRLEQEALCGNEAKEKQLKSWPTKGEIKFDHLYVRYCESDEPILANIDFTVEAGSKVLIIENAESQKSSFTTALYRLADIEGSLIIDSIDCIENLSLRQLRQTIAYVTEESIFLEENGSLRDSLDPNQEFKDDELWNALELVDLKKSFVSLEHSCCRLCPFKRKLLSLARAVLRKSKILVVDETRAADNPDDVLQRILKDSFADCTLLTIAYKSQVPKLHCDKVVVVSEDGEATEYECRDGGVQDDRIFS